MPRCFDHVDLRVRDLAAARQFYESLLPQLGFQSRVDVPSWIQYEAEGQGATEFFGITEDGAHVANASRIAFWAPTKERVDELAAQVRELGALNIEGPGFESPTYYALFFEDPSGNRLEICFRSQKFSN